MNKSTLLKKIYDSLINNIDEWEITGSFVENYELRNRINNFVIEWEGYGHPSIIEPGHIPLNDGAFGQKYKQLNKQIQAVCKRHETQVISNNYNLLNDMYDSKSTLRFSYEILYEFGEGKMTGSRAENAAVYKRQTTNFENYLAEHLSGNYKLNLHLNRKIFQIQHLNNIWISFEKEQDMLYMILKWSEYIVTGKNK